MLNTKQFNVWTKDELTLETLIKHFRQDVIVAISDSRARRTTPLHDACEKGYLEVVKLFLDIPISPNFSTIIDGKTLLHSACEGGHLEIVKELINRGADPSVKDCNNSTILHSAVVSGNIELVEYLITTDDETASGTGFVDINVVNDSNVTPLNQISVAYRDVDYNFIGRLISLGADPNIPTCDGKTILTEILNPRFIQTDVLIKRLLSLGFVPVGKGIRKLNKCKRRRLDEIPFITLAERAYGTMLTHNVKSSHLPPLLIPEIFASPSQ